jgi:hypothetical protein
MIPPTIALTHFSSNSGFFFLQWSIIVVEATACWATSFDLAASTSCSSFDLANETFLPFVSCSLSSKNLHSNGMGQPLLVPQHNQESSLKRLVWLGVQPQ